MTEHYSPLRYPGGKGKVAEYFKQLYRDNLLCDGIYVEPYAGGASVALSLLLNEYASRIVINDIDRSIYGFWDSVVNETETLCQMIYDTPINLDVWDLQKRIQKNKEAYSLLDVGFSTFFLNRTNRSGILNAGAIGGRHQSGTWKIDARFKKQELIKRIQRIALYKSRIEIYNQDAVELIYNLKAKLKKNALFYFDPPYFVKGKDLYLNYYRKSDHEKIAQAIAGIGKQKWIVTYDSVNEISNLYTNFRQVKFQLNYSAGKVGKGEELMIFSDNLFLTNHPSLKIIS